MTEMLVLLLHAPGSRFELMDYENYFVSLLLLKDITQKLEAWRYREGITPCSSGAALRHQCAVTSLMQTADLRV